MEMGPLTCCWAKLVLIIVLAKSWDALQFKKRNHWRSSWLYGCHLHQLRCELWSRVIIPNYFFRSTLKQTNKKVGFFFLVWFHWYCTGFCSSQACFADSGLGNAASLTTAFQCVPCRLWDFPLHECTIVLNRKWFDNLCQAVHLLCKRSICVVMQQILFSLLLTHLFWCCCWITNSHQWLCTCVPFSMSQNQFF